MAKAATKTKASETTTADGADIQLSSEKRLDVEGVIRKKTSFPKQKEKFLKDIGVIGWEKNSTPLMVSLFTGLPMCLIGDAGLGKTFAAKQVNKYLLATNICVIDASKADWEELVGPYSMKKYNQDEIEYLKTPMSIWNKEFIFVDEITRADTKIQNGLLEVLNEGTLQGMPTDISYKWAASNPLSYEGTQSLSEALADRFAFVLDIPGVMQMTEQDLREITKQGSSVNDKVMSRYLDSSKYKKLETQYEVKAEEFNKYLCGVGATYLDIKEKLKIDEYCVCLTRYYQSNLKRNADKNHNHFTIEARRMNMLMSVITTTLAVELYEYNTYIKSLSPEDKKKKELTTQEKTSWLHSLILQTLKWSDNTKISGKVVPPQGLEEAHSAALQFIDANDLGVREILDIKSEPDMFKKFCKAMFSFNNQPLEIHNVFTSISESFDLNEGNEFGTINVDKEDILDGYDTFLPTIFFTSKASPLRKYMTVLEPELQDKMNTFQQFAQQARLLEDPKDFIDWTPTIQEYLGKTTIVDEFHDGKAYSTTVEARILELAKEEQFIRDVVFRRLLTAEGVYSRIALSLGEREKMTGKQKEIDKENVICSQQVKEYILPYFQQIDYKVRKEFAKLKEVMEEYGIEFDWSEVK